MTAIGGMLKNKYPRLLCKQAELDSCSITIKFPCNITTKCSNP